MDIHFINYCHGVNFRDFVRVIKILLHALDTVLTYANSCLGLDSKNVFIPDGHNQWKFDLILPIFSNSKFIQYQQPAQLGFQASSFLLLNQSAGCKFFQKIIFFSAQTLSHICYGFCFNQTIYCRSYASMHQNQQELMVLSHPCPYLPFSWFLQINCNLNDYQMWNLCRIGEDFQNSIIAGWVFVFKQMFDFSLRGLEPVWHYLCC